MKIEPSRNLTDRQNDVRLTHCNDGLTDVQIASKFGIALASIRNHFAAIRNRLNVPRQDICR